jgi:hypothetical protein
MVQHTDCATALSTLTLSAEARLVLPNTTQRLALAMMAAVKVSNYLMSFNFI